MNAEELIAQKIVEAGVDEAAQRAFFYQYKKLVAKEAGLIPERSMEPVTSLPRMASADSTAAEPELTSKTVVVKLNGGLGTSMGLAKAKSLLAVRDGLTFLDIIVQQILEQKADRSSGLELLWLNSFSTSADTLSALQRYPELGPPRQSELLQNRVPKLDTSTLLPIHWPANPQLEWCPPGHGDIYPTLLGSGMLERLQQAGKEVLFVSNADNLGATLDPGLLRFFVDSGAPFLMEVTRRTEADRKGGHLAIRRSDRHYLLRELAQCPDEDLSEFQNITRHRYFNTNSIWLRLDALTSALRHAGGLLPLPLIRNEKNVDPRDKNSPLVYQLETAMGAAIECFEGSMAVDVPRSRFAPVKTTSDLLAIRSDSYELDAGHNLRLRPERGGIPPLIRLSDFYKVVDRLEELVVEGVPSLIGCKELDIQGLFRFAPQVRIEGSVKFVNLTDTIKTIPDGLYRDGEFEY